MQIRLRHAGSKTAAHVIDSVVWCDPCDTRDGTRVMEFATEDDELHALRVNDAGSFVWQGVAYDFATVTTDTITDAAPDLYAAACAFLDVVGDATPADLDRLTLQFSAAVSKARGEQC